MRLSVSLAYLVLFLPVIAGADPRPLPELAKPKADTRMLQASDVAEQLKAYSDDIGRCYLGAAGDLRGAGHLELKLSIHRTGALDSVEVATPGLPARTSKQVSKCIKAVVAEVSFPARHAPTIAVVPYFYQHTAAPNAGPQLSCWDPHGCK